MAWVNMGLITYPVGSIYMSFSGTSPASIFGGEWEQITGRFLRADNDTNTGGSDTHVHRLPLGAYVYSGQGYLGVSVDAGSWSNTGNFQPLSVARSYFTRTNIHNNDDSINYETDSYEADGKPAYQNIYVWKRTA